MNSDNYQWRRKTGAVVSTFSLSDRLNKNHLKSVKYMCIQLRNFMGAPALGVPMLPTPLIIATLVDWIHGFLATTKGNHCTTV